MDLCTVTNGLAYYSKKFLLYFRQKLLPEATLEGDQTGATTLSTMTFSIMTLSIMTLSIVKFSIMTFSIMTLSIMTLDIMIW